MVRGGWALGAWLLCACGEEEGLREAAVTPPPAVRAEAPAPPAYSIPAPLPAPATVALPLDAPHVIPPTWVTAEPSTLYLYGSDPQPQTVVLTNRGQSAVTLSAALQGSPTLALATAIDNATLAAGDSLSVTVTFTPTDRAQAGAVLTVSGAGAKPLQILVAAELLQD